MLLIGGFQQLTAYTPQYPVEGKKQVWELPVKLTIAVETSSK